MHKRVKVCIRVRPNSKTNAAASGVLINRQEQARMTYPPTVLAASVGVSTINKHTISVVTNAATGNGTCFHFDQVLDSQVDQAGVFQAAASEVVANVLSGYNGTIMAYGQTGAGKTYTMSGGKQHFQDRGICARSISTVFQHIQRDAEHSYAVRVSYVEVYNENLFDLLDFNEHTATSGGQHQLYNGVSHSSSNNNNVSSAKEELVIQENNKGQTFIKGLTRPLVKSEEDAFDLLFQGETNRTIAEHCLNAASTRSHCIFTIYLEKKRVLPGFLDATNDDQSSDVVVYSKLNLVDLAGSERMKKTGVSGTMLKEASHINKSLTFLEQVVIALGDKKRQHVPYRQTTLTNLLKDSLGGNCRTLLMACVWPDESHNDQSLATLKFATRMMRVKTSAIINVAQNGSARSNNGGLGGPSSEVIEKYAQEIKRLKEELAMYDTLNGKSHVDYDAHRITSPASQTLCREQVRSFVTDSSANPLPIVNLLQIQQLFSVFRDICIEKQQQIEDLSAQIPQQKPDSSNGRPGRDTGLSRGGNSESKMVKQLRSLRADSPPDSADLVQMKRSGGGSGHESTKLPLVTKVVPQSSSPETREDPDDDELSSRASTTLPAIHPAREPSNNNGNNTPVLSDKELFEAFKKQENPRPESILDVELAKTNLRQAKGQLASCGLEVNKLKLEIDAVSLKLQELRSSAEGGDESLPPTTEDKPESAQSQQNEQFLLVMQLKDAKKRYRDKYELFQERKAEVSYLLKIKDQMLTQLTREFEDWKSQRQ